MLVHCDECDFRFDDSLKSERNKHDKHHMTIWSYRDYYGFFYTYSERERIKGDTYNIIHDEESSLEEKIEAAELELKAYFSRSLEASDKPNKHVDVETYISMILNDPGKKKHFGPKVYIALVKKYGKKLGIRPGFTYYKTK